MWSAFREEIAGSFCAGVCGAVMIAGLRLALRSAGEQAKASRHFDFRRGALGSIDLLDGTAG